MSKKIKRANMPKKDIYLVSFSGGKDSTAMLFMLLEKGAPIDYILFSDTGVEFPEMYDHLGEINNILQSKYDLHIDYLKAKNQFIYYMTEYGRVKGKNIGMPYTFPTYKWRWCSGTLKRQPMEKFKRELRKQYEAQGIATVFHDYIGFALDEQNRVEKLLPKETEYQKFEFPLIDYKMTEKDALEYCYGLGFDWEGLYNHFSRVSCFLCPFHDRSIDLYLYEERPELAQVIIDLENSLKEKGLPWKFLSNKSFMESVETEKKKREKKKELSHGLFDNEQEK